MKTKAIIIFITLLMLLGLWVSSVYCEDRSVWINSKTCWVVESPETGKIVGIILYKASAQIEDWNDEWVKLIFAPVRNVDTGELFNGAGYYIRKSNTTPIPPGKW